MLRQALKVKEGQLNIQAIIIGASLGSYISSLTKEEALAFDVNKLDMTKTFQNVNWNRRLLPLPLDGGVRTVQYPLTFTTVDNPTNTTNAALNNKVGIEMLGAIMCSANISPNDFTTQDLYTNINKGLEAYQNFLMTKLEEAQSSSFAA